MRSRGTISLLPAVLLLVAAGLALRGYITDDTFIHLRYAENLLHHGEFSFNLGEHSYGATSPLWIFGLALLLAVGVPPLSAPLVLGALSALLTVVLAWRMLRRLDLPPLWRAAVLLLITGDVWFLRWSFSGMETPLAAALLLILLLPAVGGGGLPSGARSRHMAWGAAAGLAGLVRPEFMLIVPLAWPPLAWAGRTGAGGGRRFSWLPDAVFAAAGWLLVLGPWLGFAWWSFGRLTPGTAAAKSAAVTLAPAVVLPYVKQAVAVLTVTQGLVWAGLLAVAVWVWRGRRGPRAQEEVRCGFSRGEIALIGAVLTWSVVLMGGYAVKQVWIISRYICPLAPGLLLVAAVVARRTLCGLSAPTRRRASWLLGVVVAAALLINGWVFVRQVVPHARRFPAGIRECYVCMGQWLHDNTPEDAVVAALDIGAVGYVSGRRVLDLMGLVSPEVLAVGQRLGFQEMVKDGAWLEIPARPGGGPPDYFIDRCEGAPRWAGRTVRGVSFELLRTCEIHGVGLREPQTWTVALYRLFGPATRTSPSAGG